MRRIAAILPVLLLLAATASANPLDVFGAGPRAISMSGAFTGVADDGAAAYYNPAGLAQIARFQFEGGYLYAQPNLRLNGQDNGVDPNKGTYFAFVSSQKILDHRLTVGVNLFFPDQHVLRFLMLPNTNPRFSLYYNDNHALSAYVCGGLEVLRWLYLGAGINYIGGNKGGVDFEISEKDPSRGSLKSRIGNVITPVGGLMFLPHRTVRIGATYRHPTDVELYLPNRIVIPAITIFDSNPIPIIEKTVLTLLTTAYSHFSPRQVALGASWRITDRVMVAADLTWMQWSEMRNPTPYTTLKLEGGFAKLFPSTPTYAVPDPNLHDTFVTALGAEGVPLTTAHVDLRVRLGYAYRPTPVPPQGGEMNFVDSDAHIVSAGLGLDLKGLLKIVDRPLSLDAFFQAHLLEPRTFTKNRLWDPVGDYTATGEVYQGGAALTVRF
jgi:long-chain fatty acid transport protein